MGLSFPKHTVMDSKKKKKKKFNVILVFYSRVLKIAKVELWQH